MMNITPLNALNDNYIWMISYQGQAVCIDPGEAEAVQHFIEANHLTLTHILITHPHYDHQNGIAKLKQAFPQVKVYGADDIAEADCMITEGMDIPFGSGSFKVWHTPGHTAGHHSFLLNDSEQIHVFCGDTLFSAGCGRVFDGTMEQMFHTLNRFNTLPESTLFYPAHEYTAANLRFATHIEPNNIDIQTASDTLRIPSLPVSLVEERKINPFLRTSLSQVCHRAEELTARSLADSYSVFTALRELKNSF